MNQDVSISSHSAYDSVAHDPVKTRLSESEADQSAYSFPLIATPIMLFSLDRKRRSHTRNRKKWKCPYSSGSDSVKMASKTVIRPMPTF